MPKQMWLVLGALYLIDFILALMNNNIDVALRGIGLMWLVYVIYDKAGTIEDLRKGIDEVREDFKKLTDNLKM